jgi:5-methylcytosine-specific restriction endonuclease McrA
MPSCWKDAPSAISKGESKRQRERFYLENCRLARIRDGHHCRICGGQFNLETHHLVPRSLVGKANRDHLSNLVTVCREDHEQVTRHVIRLYPLDPEQGANGKLKVVKYCKHEQGYVTVTEAA